jgi:hypothetical protein
MALKPSKAIFVRPGNRRLARLNAAAGILGTNKSDLLIALIDWVCGSGPEPRRITPGSVEMEVVERAGEREGNHEK